MATAPRPCPDVVGASDARIDTFTRAASPRTVSCPSAWISGRTGSCPRRPPPMVPPAASLSSRFLLRHDENGLAFAGRRRRHGRCGHGRQRASTVFSNDRHAAAVQGLWAADPLARCATGARTPIWPPSGRAAATMAAASLIEWVMLVTPELFSPSARRLATFISISDDAARSPRGC